MTQWPLQYQVFLLNYIFAFISAVSWSTSYSEFYPAVWFPLPFRYGREAKVVHFLGKVKPWNYTYDTKSKSVKGHSQDPSTLHPDYLLQWWDLFSTSVLSLMKEEYGDQPFHSGCEAPVSRPPLRPTDRGTWATCPCAALGGCFRIMWFKIIFFFFV